MQLSLATWSLIQALVEGIPAIANIAGYVNGYGAAGMFPSVGVSAEKLGAKAIVDPLGHVALLFETSQTLMLSFAALPGFYLFASRASNGACKSYIVGSIAYNFLIGAVLARRTVLGLPGIGPSPPQIPGVSPSATNTILGISGFLLHAVLGVLQVWSVMTVDDSVGRRKRE